MVNNLNRQLDAIMAQRGHVAGLVLAAGKGTRMKSDKPKVLHRLLDEPMLWYVYQALSRLLPEANIFSVVGFGSQEVAKAFPHQAERFVFQEQQLGTGHALQCAYPRLVENGFSKLLVVNGDAPLLTGQALERLLAASQEQAADIAFISLELADPTGYGRVVRTESGDVQAIVEDKDLASRPGAQAIQEVNAGIYCFDVAALVDRLEGLSNQNAQGEYYITELIDLALASGGRVVAVNEGEDEQFLGVNSPRELIGCEELLKQRRVDQLLDSGVTVHAPDLVRIGPEVSVEPGAELSGPLEIFGRSRIEAGARVDSNVWMRDAGIGPSAWIRQFSHLESVQVGQGCQVGPYARLRPETVLEDGAKVGNFVEVKKSRLAAGAKANHLAYLGDTQVGEQANIGAGTITCNYDGKNKHVTTIGSKSFIGSNTALVAPVEIGEESLVGAGSVITRDVPGKSLAVARSKQKNLPLKKVGD